MKITPKVLIEEIVPEALGAGSLDSLKRVDHENNLRTEAPTTPTTPKAGL